MLGGFQNNLMPGGGSQGSHKAGTFRHLVASATRGKVYSPRPPVNGLVELPEAATPDADDHNHNDE